MVKMVDLSGAQGALKTKKFVDMAFILFMVGLLMLIIGSPLAFYSEGLTAIYCGVWIGISGFVVMIYAIIKILKNIITL